MESVLLLRPDQAGDALKSLPALRQLRALRPDLELHVLASDANASLLEAEEGWTVHRLPIGWRRASTTELSDHFAQVFSGRRFDRAVSLLCDASDGLDRLMRSVPARAKFAASLPDELVTPLHLPNAGPVQTDESKNIARLLSQALEIDLVEGLDGVDRRPTLTHEDVEEAEKTLGAKTGKWLGVCPFSTIKKRNLSLARWEKLIALAVNESEFERLVFFGLPEHRESLERLCDASGGLGTIAYPTSIRSLGAHLVRLDGVIAVDSAPLHLSLSLGVPSLGFLSGGDVARWFPRTGPLDELLRRGVISPLPSWWEMRFAFKRWRRRNRKHFESFSKFSNIFLAKKTLQ